MVLWSDYLDNLAGYMGVDATSAGIIFSLLFIICAVLIVAIASDGHSLGSLMTGYMGMIIFTVTGWLPYWIILMFTLFIAGLYASQIRDWFMSSGRAVRN